MSLIQDFEKLHITVKSSALIIFGQMPFFFVAIYLFNNKLISLVSENPFYDMDFIFLLSLCFCLSITWFAMNLVLTFIVFKFGDYINDDYSEIDDVFKASIIYSLGYLSIAILINIFLQLGFFWFLILAYGFIVFRLVYTGTACYIYSKKQKKKID